jgi:hypothetical protein
LLKLGILRFRHCLDTHLPHPKNQIEYFGCKSNCRFRMEKG